MRIRHDLRHGRIHTRARSSLARRSSDGSCFPRSNLWIVPRLAPTLRPRSVMLSPRRSRRARSSSPNVSGRNRTPLGCPTAPAREVEIAEGRLALNCVPLKPSEGEIQAVCGPWMGTEASTFPSAGLFLFQAEAPSNGSESTGQGIRNRIRVAAEKRNNLRELPDRRLSPTEFPVSDRLGTHSPALGKSLLRQPLGNSRGRCPTRWRLQKGNATVGFHLPWLRLAEA